MKKTLKILLAIIIALVIAVVGYLAYVVISYDRIEDMQAVDVSGDATAEVPVNQGLALVTYNIGFGAYSADYSFFMDGGEYARAYSRDAVIGNTNGAVDAIKSAKPDFILLQEVDVKGTRSYKVNQVDIFADAFAGLDRAFALNYDSPYLFYPFNEPIGANKSGLLTLSEYGIESSLRRSLPIEKSLYKYLDLDRAYTVSRLKTDNGKELVLYNVHLSAYTSDGTIADEQLEMLLADMQSEYEKGNYTVAAGDFNKDLLGDSSEYFERAEMEATWAKPIKTELLPEDFRIFSGKNKPTCRNADAAFKGDGTDFVLSVDGAIVSPNVSVAASLTVDTGFAYSDHNPVKLEFSLSE